MISNNKLGFGYNVFYDTGASREGGSIKISLRSSKDNAELKKMDDTVCEGGIKNSATYVEGIASHIAQTIEKSKPEIEKLEGQDRFLEGIVGFVPGQTLRGEKGFYAPILANINDTNKKALRNVDYSPIDSYLKQKNIEFATKPLVHVETNDMMGGILGIAKQHKDLMKDGLFGALFMTGGGFGVSYLEVVNIDGKDYLHAKACESGHNRTSIDSEIYEKGAASVPALIGNFCEELGLKKDSYATVALQDIGNARLVTQHSFDMENTSEFYAPRKKFDDKSQAQVLEDTGMFDISKKGEKVSVALKPNENLAPATDRAVDKYVNSIAHLAHIKANEGYNKIFLANDLAVGLDKHLSAKGETLAEKVKQATRNHLDDAGKNISRIYNFDVIVETGIKDNTVGGKVLLDGNFNASRGNSFLIPVDKL